jgi:uncharacterized LabA/DUF88 family protein
VANEHRLGLFIDGPNLFQTAKTLGFDIDYKRLLNEFEARGEIVRASYYTTVLSDEQENIPIRPLLDWLDYNGYTLVTKPGKEYEDSFGRRRLKNNMAIELTIDALELSARLDEMVLFSGDGDYRSLIEAVQRRGVRVTVVSTISTQPIMVSDELRRQADDFIDLFELRPRVGRDSFQRVAHRDAVAASSQERPIVEVRRVRAAPLRQTQVKGQRTVAPEEIHIRVDSPSS